MTSRGRRSGSARVALSILFALANLVFIVFAVIAWSTSRLDVVIDLVLLGASCVVGLLVNVALLARRASSARLAFIVALLRIPAFALAIYLVAVNTSFRLLPGAPLLVIGFLEISATFVLAAATTSALRSASHD